MNSGAVVTIEATKEKLTFGGSALFPKFYMWPNSNSYQRKLQKWCGWFTWWNNITYPHEGYLQDRMILQTLIEIEGGRKPKDYALASNFMWAVPWH
jgi:NADP-dependent alcohol dehydrogenase